MEWSVFWRGLVCSEVAVEDLSVDTESCTREMIRDGLGDIAG